MRTTSDVTVERPMALLDWGRLRADEYTRQWNESHLTEDHRDVVPERLLGELWGYNTTFSQLIPVREKVPSLWRLQDRDSAVTVVGIHRSKSIVLPVYRVAIPWLGTITMRDNFYDWCVSCDFELPLPLDTYGDLYRVKDVKGFFEGFDRAGAERYGPFIDNQRQFSICLPADFSNLYLFMGLTRFAAQRVEAVVYPR